MNKCSNCQYKYHHISKEPCFSCVTTTEKPNFVQEDIPTLTNFDYIKTMTKEQMALWLSQIMDCSVCQHELLIECDESCKIQMLKWLEEEKA